MSRRRLLVAALFGVLAVCVIAACEPQPPAGAGSDVALLARGAEGYTEARLGRRLNFPADHGPHPAYRIEWWYLTANLFDAEGAPYGVQWTLFRLATRPGETSPPNPWQHPQVYMAHFALSSAQHHQAWQRYARGGKFEPSVTQAEGEPRAMHSAMHSVVAQAGVKAEPFHAWIDDWYLRSGGPGWLPLVLHAREDDAAVDLRLDSAEPPLLQGEAGFSQKHPAGGGSHYYSQPFLVANGTIDWNGQRIAVTGTAWLDREWSSQYLQADQQGWDWFALHLDSGEKLMLFQLRPNAQAENAAPYRHGVLIAPDGERQVLDPAALEFQVIETSEVAGRQLPLHWRIRLPEPSGRRLDVIALHPDQWMDLDFPYWEGVVRVEGDNPGARGWGYLELTGYATQ